MNCAGVDMDIPKKTPTFNLKAVSRETGVKPHTLRAWEQRYGLPQPKRTVSGHRLYSQYDIEIVKWLNARQEEGLAISRAVELWFELEQKGQDPLRMVSSSTADLTGTAETGSALSDLRQKWINGCLNFDEPAAERALGQAFAIYPIKMVCLEILQRGLANIGDLWHQNKATVQQEHFASAVAIQKLDALLAAAPLPSRSGRILVACPPYEEHTIPLQLISLLLRYQGWEVVFLRANVPLDRLETTVDVIRPNLIVMGAQQLYTAASLLEVSRLLEERNIPVGFGGLIFNMIPTLHQRIPGHFLGKNIEDAVTAVEQIMAFNLPPALARPPTEEYARALAAFRANLARIEADTWQMIHSENTPYEHIDATNTRVAQAIKAGLRLGDMDYLNNEIALERQLIMNYGVSLDWQYAYFKAYYRAAHKHLPLEGRPILEWLSRASEEGIIAAHAM